MMTQRCLGTHTYYDVALEDDSHFLTRWYDDVVTFIILTAEGL